MSDSSSTLLFDDDPKIALRREDSDELLFWCLLKITGYEGELGGDPDFVDDPLVSMMDCGREGIFSFILEGVLPSAKFPDDDPRSDIKLLL